jgi:F0F1-type ATP synthase membrane subunit b/b'
MMNGNRRTTALYLILFLLLCLAPVHPARAQGGAAPAANQSLPAQTPAANATAPAAPQAANAAASEPATGKKEAAEKEDPEIAGMKHSAVVQWIARHLGLSLDATYWIFTIANFVIFVALLVWAGRKAVPLMLKGRTQSIRKGIDDARAASQAAELRLQAIEEKLAGLDREVERLHTEASATASAEQQKMRQQSEQEARAILDNTAREIETMTRAAQRELLRYEVGLSVSLAEKQVHVDDKGDEALVRDLAGHLRGEEK